MFHRSHFLRDTLLEAVRAMQGAYPPPRTDDAYPEGSVEWLLSDNQWFLDSQWKELEETFSKSFARRLADADPDVRAKEPRIYRAVERTFGFLLVSNFGPHFFGTLNTATLAELFTPERLGESLTLEELRAIPAVVKLIVLEKIAHTVLRGEGEQTNALLPNREGELFGLIGCLQSLGRVRWRILIEAISPVHLTLSKDPAGVYPAMDYESRDMYSQAVERLAVSSGEREDTIAGLAIQLAQRARDIDSESQKHHVGYYLVGPGAGQLKKRGHLHLTGIEAFRDALLRHPAAAYFGASIAGTAVATWLLFEWMRPMQIGWIALFCLLASTPIIALMNLATTQLLRRRSMPRIDFSRGIPDEDRTMVVVPTLLLSRTGVEKLVSQLEIHFLANPDRNLSFALLTDFPDSDTPPAEDDALLQMCARGIRRLNSRYRPDGHARFFLFHRSSEWNECQGKWMGRERKRGKLEDFNRLLLGIDDAFDVKVGDLSLLKSIRHIITLDSDAQLSPDAAWKLVGTLAHPLHRPVVCEHTKTIKSGYTILQPNVSTSVESGGKSIFAKIGSGSTGLDPYTNARADLYQDLFGQSSYYGKGIYNLETFHAVLDERFPDNTLLSHDLIEGEHTRVGLVTAADVVEDFPRTYEAFSKRKHRWVRGDWQIAQWLFRRVPDKCRGQVRNSLGLLSRWKIADNLRRSVFEIAAVGVIAGALFFGAQAFFHAIAAIFVILLLPAYAAFAVSTLRMPARRYWRTYFRGRLADLWLAHCQAALDFVFLPHQAYLMADAIGRTLVRQWFTKRNLLEWETMAQAEQGSGGLFATSNSATSICAGLVACWVALHHPFHLRETIVAGLWIFAPLIALSLKLAPWKRHRTVSKETGFLRDIALRTWRYFVDFGRPEENWLVPDNIQEEPYSEARKTSPTNLGLQLACNVAALDFGYLSRTELVVRVGDLLGTIERMQKHRGHIFNWYDTETLEPLTPRYVSTVDSGNLAASLIAVRQACLRIGRSPLIDASVFEGIRDHCLQLRRILPVSVGLTATFRLLSTAIRSLEGSPQNLFEWDQTLGRVREILVDLNPRIETVSHHIESHDVVRAEELRYWLRAVHVRISAARTNLHDFAPWLKPEYQACNENWRSDPRFEDLISECERVPRFGELPVSYERVEECITELLGAQSSTLEGIPAETLLSLRAEVFRAKDRHDALIERFALHAATAQRFAKEMDFAFLFDEERELMHIGYNAEAAKLDASYYDLLASEARTALFLAVAKRDAPLRSWFQLGRKITSYRGHDTLMSWSGTMFEYLMPSIFMRSYSTTLLDQSMKGVVRVQQAYAREFDIPWGISESSCSWRNEDMQYVYHAFGIREIALGGQKSGRLVIAPYASMLALMTDHRTAAKNLKSMAFRGWMGRYGFFEAAEFRQGQGRLETVVRSFMAHHQGMGLLALCNSLLGNPMQERFHAEPMVAATELLLQERMPAVFSSR